MKDEELLALYRKYKKKRIIFIISIIIVLTLIIGLIFIYLRFNNVSSSNINETPTQRITIEDTEAPLIKLKLDYLEIEQGDDIDYLKYVESVTDNVDGDLFNKLEYDKIDTSVLGEQKIIYRVSDNSNNKSQMILLTIIKEKESLNDTKESNTSTDVNIKENKPKVPNSNKKPTSENSTQNKEQKEPQLTQEEVPKNENNISKKIIKYFLFSDGYTMENVAEICASELKKTNRTGMCKPIQDENGIYLGMQLETN